MTNQPNAAPDLDSTDRARIATTLDRAVDALISLQQDDGHWCGELQGDSILASEYLLMKFILAQERQPMHDGADPRVTLGKIARWMLMQQREDGTWGQYPGAKMDISATVKAYFSLKLLGHDPRAASGGSRFTRNGCRPVDRQDLLGRGEPSEYPACEF